MSTNSRKAGDFDALKAKTWRLVEEAEKLVGEAQAFEEKKGSLHCAKQVFESFAVLLDKHDRARDVEQLRKKFEDLQASIESKTGTPVRRRGGTRSPVTA